jgi:hypothetical protein
MRYQQGEANKSKPEEFRGRWDCSSSCESMERQVAIILHDFVC